jgi:hypothetical protein
MLQDHKDDPVCLCSIWVHVPSIIQRKVTITFGGIPCMSKDANCKGYRMQEMRYKDRSVKGNEGERRGKGHGRQCHHTYPIGIHKRVAVHEVLSEGFSGPDVDHRLARFFSPMKSLMIQGSSSGV